MRAIAIVSGGLDSITMVEELRSQGYAVDMLSFNYGQRHKKELDFASYWALSKGLHHDIVDLSSITRLISNSALTSDHKHAEGNDIIDVPDGHYAEDSMKATVVPNRNMIMLSIACGVAVNRGANTVGVGVHAGDHFIYPDCRPEFIFAAGQAMLLGNEGFHNFTSHLLEKPYEIQGKKFHSVAYPIKAPFLSMSKEDIAFRALELGVPFHQTWSCYKGGEKHCGRCGTCVERLEAINGAIRRLNRLKREDYDKVVGKHPITLGLWDKTEYEDLDFWYSQVTRTATDKEAAE